MCECYKNGKEYCNEHKQIIIENRLERKFTNIITKNIENKFYENI